MSKMEDLPINSVSDFGYHGTNALASLRNTVLLNSASVETIVGLPKRCDLNTFPYLCKKQNIVVSQSVRLTTSRKILTYRRRRLFMKLSGHGEKEQEMKSRVSPKKGQPEEPRGSVRARAFDNLRVFAL